MRSNKPLLSVIIDAVLVVIKPILRRAVSIDFVKIISVDKQKMIATVESYEDKGQYKVPLALDSNLQTAWISPKIDTNAYVCANNGEKYFVKFEQIENIVIGHGNTVQGVIKIKEQQDEINKLKDKLNELTSKFNNLQNDYKTHNHTHPQGNTIALVMPFIQSDQQEAAAINKGNYELGGIIQVKY